MNDLPRATPEAQGASSAGLAALIDAFGELGGVHSVMVLRGGAVIAECWWEPYAAATPHMMFSLSKSFTSTAVGIAISEGRLSLDDRVIDILSEDAPADPGENLAAMTVRHLLTMTTGHAQDTLARLVREDDHWARAILSEPVDHVPGSHFVYNTGATYLLSVILQKLTGQRLVDYLTPRLLAPLGIVGAEWQQSPDGVDTGGFGLSVLTEDVAKFGQLYLQHGLWEGVQLVPAEWVAEATSPLVPNTGDSIDWQSGYGYQFWQNRDGSYRGDGAFGQFCLVLDELDAVIVTTGAMPDMKPGIDLIFEHAVPALTGSTTSTVLPVTRLTPTPAATRRDYDQRFFFPTNPLKITTAGISGEVFTLDGHTIPFAAGAWVAGGRYPVDGVLEPTAASGGWIDDRHFFIEILAVRTPYAFTLTIELDGDTVDLRVEQNVSFDPRRSWRLVGGISTEE